MFRRLAFGHLYAIYLAQNLDIYHRCMSTVHQPLRCTLLYIHRDSEYFWNSVGENAEFLTRSADKIVCGTLKFTYNTRLQIKILLFSGLEYIRLWRLLRQREIPSRGGQVQHLLTGIWIPCKDKYSTYLQVYRYHVGTSTAPTYRYTDTM